MRDVVLGQTTSSEPPPPEDVLLLHTNVELDLVQCAPAGRNLLFRTEAEWLSVTGGHLLPVPQPVLHSCDGISDVSTKIQQRRNSLALRLAEKGQFMTTGEAYAIWHLNSIRPFGSGENSKPTHIYFMRHGDKVKIGKSNHVRRRMGQLGHHRYDHTKAMKSFFGYGCDEPQIHCMFNVICVGGEWFSWCKPIEDFCNAMCSQ